VRTLAHQIANAIPEYRAALEHKQSQLAEDELDALTATELFDRLLVQPLHKIPPPLHTISRSECRKMLVIDALDEAEHDKKNELLRLIKTEFSRLPKWLKVLVTGRPEVPIKEALSILLPRELDAKDYDEDCDRDVEIFLRCVLKPPQVVAARVRFGGWWRRRHFAVEVAAHTYPILRNFISRTPVHTRSCACRS